ncbi:hypothetical protein AFLA_003409 [Aspergillus flavus NRRL3357]|nr:hypothetical protein AFLA_003409 [Aspergillus flavus NRRL3357]
MQIRNRQQRPAFQFGRGHDAKSVELPAVTLLYSSRDLLHNTSHRDQEYGTVEIRYITQMLGQRGLKGQETLKKTF